MAASVVNESKTTAVKIARQKSSDFTVLTKVDGGVQVAKQRSRTGTVFHAFKTLGDSANTFLRRRAGTKDVIKPEKRPDPNAVVLPRLPDESSSEEETSSSSDEEEPGVRIVVDEIEISEDEMALKPKLSEVPLLPDLPGPIKPAFLKSRSQARLMQLKRSNPRELERSDSAFGMHRSDSMAKNSLGKSDVSTGVERSGEDLSEEDAKEMKLVTVESFMGDANLFKD
tara:strand:- start:1381 stop:2061 length:681 start_codon:yes stop_codon:yes gene_type:complete